MGFSRLSRYDSYFGGEDNVYGGRIMPPLVTQHFTIVRVVLVGGMQESPIQVLTRCLIAVFRQDLMYQYDTLLEKLIVIKPYNII